MITPASAVWNVLHVEGFFVSVEDMPADPRMRDQNSWYGVACLKMPDFPDCPNNFIAVLDIDFDRN